MAKIGTGVKNAWLTSFIDLVLLITCFFIMIYSSLVENSNKYSGINGTNNNYIFSFERSKQVPNKLDLIFEIIKKSLVEANLLSQISITHDPNSIILEVSDDLFGNGRDLGGITSFFKTILFYHNSHQFELKLSLPAKKMSEYQYYIEESLSLYNRLSDSKLNDNIILKMNLIFDEKKNLLEAKPKLHLLIY